MSVKGKNLSYEAQEPSFLRKLRAQQGGLDSDRHERPVARPKRLAVDQEDDEPTYVDEASNQTLSREEYKALVSGDVEPASRDKNEDSLLESEKNSALESTNVKLPDSETTHKKQEVTEAGKGQKKRKIAKAVATDVEEEGQSKPQANPKPEKKKVKSVKLSFGDEHDS